jgi:hypothetical protein
MLINLRTLEDAVLQTTPFEHVLVSDFIAPQAQDGILADYPQMDHAGSFPLSSLRVGPCVNALVEDLRSAAFEAAVAAKFEIDLSRAKTMITLRGQCAPRDGQIHTDSKTKLISVLLYLNPPWRKDGGRLRLLRNGKDIDAAAVEIAPDFGTLLVFKRSEHSWHGHQSFAGARKVLQMNWVTNTNVAAWEGFRHGVSALVKRAASAVPSERN